MASASTLSAAPPGSANEEMTSLGASRMCLSTECQLVQLVVDVSSGLDNSAALPVSAMKTGQPSSAQQVLTDHHGHVSTMTSLDQMHGGLYELITSHIHLLIDHVGNRKRSTFRRQEGSETASSVYVCDGSAGPLPAVSISVSPSIDRLMPSFSNMTTESELSGTTPTTADDTVTVSIGGIIADVLVVGRDKNFRDDSASPEIVCDRHRQCSDVIALAAHPETFVRTLIEVVMPFVMAGFGCMFAGIVLDHVTHWPVFKHVTEILILVPALLGLKGNTEMTSASRMSTQANLGNLDSTSAKLKIMAGSLALTQVQAVVVGFMAAVMVMLLGWAPQRKFDLIDGFLLCASSVVTASVASIVLGSLMICVVLLSRRFNINPDNVATPVGGALGDLVTLLLLSSVAQLLFTTMEAHPWVPPLVLCLALCFTPVWWMIAERNKYTHGVLYHGWFPVIGAMAISSIGGLILDLAVTKYEGIAVFQPVFNGVGGNLVAVQASRLATALHRASAPRRAACTCPNIIKTFFDKSASARTARVLMLLVVPGHVMFMFTIQYFRQGHTTLTPLFATLFLLAAVTQVATLLFIANWFVPWLWSRGYDPDNFSIPFLTALGDLLGGMLLAMTFHLLYVIGDEAVVSSD